MFLQNRVSSPQGLKPVSFAILSGTAKAMPYPKPILKAVQISTFRLASTLS